MSKEYPGIDEKSLRLKRIIVFLLFFGSGVSGLVYEVVWTRHLTYLFGATLFAVATVLSAFMGGMALGSYVFGKIADRTKNNLRSYGYLQTGIGIAALLLPLLLKILNPVYKFAYIQFEASFYIMSLLRFLLSFAALLIPTTLMGATLPVLSRFLVRRNETLGLRVGALYSVNTLGAVLGCFLTGFFFIAAFGVQGATFIAVAINIIVGIISLIMAAGIQERYLETDEIKIGEAPAVKKYSEKEAAKPEEHKQARKILYSVLISYGISGFIALSYQVAWSRALVFTFEIMKNTTYSFTAMLTVFLVGLAIGGAIMSAFIDKQRDPLRLYGLIQLIIGLSGAFSFLIIYYIGPGIEPFSFYNEAGEIIWSKGVLNVFAKTGAAIFLPTLLMGMAFPVATKICVDRIKSVGFGVGRIYSVNTLGAIIGAFAAGFVLIPVLGVAGTIYILAAGNLAIALWMFAINPLLNKNQRTVLIASAIVVALVILIRIPLNARFQDLSPTEESLFYQEGPLATVSVVENSFQYRTIYVDNVGVAGTDRILLTDQKSLAHVPLLLLEDPKSALTVGFGSGGASFSYTTYDSMEDIHCVEICKTVLDAAPDLLASNNGILLPESRIDAPMPKDKSAYQYIATPGYRTFDPRYKIIIDDVRSYLNFTGKKYDIIATDCTDLRYKSNANLYDLEYFQLCRDHLTDDGMVVVWMPLAGLSDEMFRLALRTFYRVFPNMSIWYMNNEPTHYILILGTKGELKADYALMKEKLKEKDVNADLAELYLNDVDKILSCYICDEKTLDKFLEGERVNTENHPFLEFESPKYGYGEQPMIDNLNSLMGIRNRINDYLYNVPDLGAFEAQLQRYWEGEPYIIEGHAEYRNLEMVPACRSYMKAVEACPEDDATKYLLDFDELKLRLAARPRDGWAYRQLGAVFYEQGRWEDSVTWLTGFIENVPAPPANAPEETVTFYNQSLVYAYKTIGECYLRTGRPKQAKRYLQKALELAPMDNEIQEALDETQLEPGEEE